MQKCLCCSDAEILFCLCEHGNALLSYTKFEKWLSKECGFCSPLQKRVQLICAVWSQVWFKWWWIHTAEQSQVFRALFRRSGWLEDIAFWIAVTTYTKVRKRRYDFLNWFLYLLFISWLSMRKDLAVSPEVLVILKIFYVLFYVLMFVQCHCSCCLEVSYGFIINENKCKISQYWTFLKVVYLEPLKIMLNGSSIHRNNAS